VPVIEQATLTWDTASLVAALDQAGVPCAPIADYGEVFTDEHLHARGFFWDAPHPVLGDVRQLGSPMRMSATPPVRRCAGPPLGADTGEVLAAHGFGPDEIAALQAAGAIRWDRPAATAGVRSDGTGER
jgi:formyl-CoA transferase